MGAMSEDALSVIHLEGESPEGSRCCATGELAAPWKSPSAFSSLTTAASSSSCLESPLSSAPGDGLLPGEGGDGDGDSGHGGAGGGGGGGGGTDLFPGAECQPPAATGGEKPAREDVLEELDTFFRQVSMLSQFTAATSKPMSDLLYAEASQTLIIFDWDDTLFPTSELFDRWGLSLDSSPEEDLRPTPEQEGLLQSWRQALKEYLEQACALSETCLIITNSRRPWVSCCIERFAPELRGLFERPHNAPRVVYADERLKSTKTFKSQCMDLRPVKFRANALFKKTAEETVEECTMAKYAAMKAEAKRFYSKYPGQSWKNILSIGDMRYERDALQELSFRRVPQGRERLRTKTLVLPPGASVSEITLRLQFSTIMLPAYVRYDGDFDLDLQEAPDPLSTIADGLKMPELATLSFSRHAWGREAPPKTEDDKQEGLAHVAVCVHQALFG